MKTMEIPPKASTTRDDDRRAERGYTISNTGNVVVDVDQLLRSPRAQELATKARRFVVLQKRGVSAK